MYFYIRYGIDLIDEIGRYCGSQVWFMDKDVYCFGKLGKVDCFLFGRVVVVYDLDFFFLVGICFGYCCIIIYVCVGEICSFFGGEFLVIDVGSNNNSLGIDGGVVCQMDGFVLFIGGDIVDFLWG